MKTPSILIYGAGGHAKVVADLARLCKIDIAGFIDDTNTNREGQQFCGSRIYNDVERARYKSSDPDLGVIVAVGDCEARGRITAKLVEHNFKLLSLIHPAATVAQPAQISPGTVVMAGVIINADVLVGRNVIVNTGAIIEHDCVIEDGVHICPGVRLGGGVKVGSETWIGIGAIVKDRVRIGKGVIVGAGSLVLKDVADQVTVYGSPASVRK